MTTNEKLQTIRLQSPYGAFLFATYKYDGASYPVILLLQSPYGAFLFATLPITSPVPDGAQWARLDITNIPAFFRAVLAAENAKYAISIGVDFTPVLGGCRLSSKNAIVKVHFGPNRAAFGTF